MTAATCRAGALSAHIASRLAAECGDACDGRRLSCTVPAGRGLRCLSQRVSRRVEHGIKLNRRDHVASGKRSRGSHIVALAADGESSSASVAVTDKNALLGQLKEALAQKDSEGAKAALEALKEGGHAKLWNSYGNVTRRTTFVRELTQLGIKNAETLAIPSVRNDALFLTTVVGVTSVLAVIAGQLPGDWGFFVPYLLGGVSLVVLAIGSTAPGLLEAGIQLASQGFSDTKERVRRHEAAHFLVAYLVGLPIVAYSLDISAEHVNLVDQKLQRRIYEGRLDSNELDKLAAVSMAGLAAEGLNYDKVVGQSADLFSLQRLINRSKPPLSSQQQQNLTRWAVHFAASVIKSNSKAYEALQEAMAKGSSVEDCIAAIEAA